MCFLLVNLSKKAKLMNNTKVVISSIMRNYIAVRTVQRDTLHLIPRVHFNIEVKSKKRNVISFTLRRRQYPFRLCYAMTIDKSQGQELKRISIDLRTPCFSHGQLYVAYSRAVLSANVLTLVTDESRCTSGDDIHLTLNFVHTCLLK